MHSAGQLKFKADLTGVGCGNASLSPKIVSFHPAFACYKPDAAYSDASSPTTNWQSHCAGIPLPDPEAPTGTPAKVAVLGVCQSATIAGNPQTAPATGNIFESGQTIIAN